MRKETAAKALLAEGDQLWDSGQKDQAVAKYKTLLDKNLSRVPNESERPRVFLRVIDFEVEHGNLSAAKSLIEEALDKSVELRSENAASITLIARVQSKYEKKEQEEREAREKKARKDWPYQFVKSKTEQTGQNNVMDLYAFSGAFDLADLKAFCQQRKETSPANVFYYVVIFDDSANAKFPSSPFTAQFGIEEDALKHIRAIYVYNKVNGFSELRYYGGNAWESKAKYEQI